MAGTRRAILWPRVGFVRFGSLRRLTPISSIFGADRGKPIDRYYIEDFLSRHAGEGDYSPGLIRGRVLEIGEARYAPAYATAGRVERIDVLDVSSNNPQATVIGDLATGHNLQPDTYDCVVCTQTLLLIYDVKGAVETLHRILKPGGAVLATVPGISRICRPDMDIWGDYWRFTSLSVRRLFEEVFESADVTVEAYGNVLAASAFLYGLAAEDLKREELEARDPNFEMIVAAKAFKR